MLWHSTIRLGRFLLAWLYVLVVCIAACVMVVLAGPTRMWLFMMPRWAKGTLKVVGITLRIDGAEHLAGPGIFVSNHTSLIDVVILPAIVPPKTKVVAKRELIYVPFLGWAFGASGAVLVDRRNARAAVASMRAALAKLPAGWSIAVFPEGTRSRTATMRPFKKGAFHMAVATGLPIIPVGLDGAQDVSPPGKWLVRGGEVRICVGAPISTAGWRNGQLAEPMQATRDAVQRCIDHAVAMRGDLQP
jgi:1-acyl-sn-glycerol-3-phosphate acyltransferase